MKKFAKKILVISLSIILVLVTTTFGALKAQAAVIGTTSVQLGDPRPSQTGVTYTVGLTFPSVNNLQCIQVKFATSVSMATPATTMTSASGFTLSGGGLTQGNWTNYGATNGTLEIYAGSNQTPTATALTITWTGVTNTSLATEYAQITTYSTQTSSGASCTGQVDQSAVMALVTTAGLNTSVTVDPTLTFSIADYGTAVNGSGSTTITTSSTTIPFGTVAAGGTALGSQTLTVSTNAAGGYTVYVRYTGSPSDGNGHTIADTSGDHATPTAFSAGSALGYTVDEGSLTQFTSNTWSKFTTTNAAVANATGPVSSDANHIAYKIGIGATQAPGVYNTVVTLTATPTY